MKQISSTRNSFWIWVCLPLLIACVGSFLSALEVSITADERIYQFAGLEYLRSGNFSINFEHPPFSKWFGALLPYFSAHEELSYFRVSHILLYMFTGLGISLYLLKQSKPFAAFVWSLLYFFCPNARALASLHITDSDVACFSLLSAFCFWVFWKRPKVWLLCLSAFFISLSILSKFTALLLVPFFVFALLKSYRSGKIKKEAFFWVIGSIALAFLCAYLFYPKAILWYGKGIDAQKLHNRAADHATSFFGTISSRGFWNYYLLSFLAKTPPFHLGLLGLGLILGIRNFSRLKLEWAVFVLPSLALFVYLSRLNVQLGLRYALPAIFLLYFFSAQALELLSQELKNLILQKKICLLLLSGLFIWDARNFQKQDYLSYFNFLAPSPARNFADGNNDWGQKLPKRLTPYYPELRDIDEIKLPALLEELSSKKRSLEDSLYIAVGASDLAGLFRAEGFYFRALTPLERIGAFEIYKISYRQFFQIQAAHQKNKLPRFRNPSPDQLKEWQNIDACSFTYLIEEKDYQLPCTKN